ncbi:MAG: hypothetical protein AAF702_02460 [Chloroflexota bacterium]
MQALVLSPELTQMLTVEAQRVGKTISVLAEEWLRQQYQALRREQLAAQTEKFWANYRDIYAQYPNEFVAFYDDQILDHDTDITPLAVRIREKYDDLPIVITQAVREPIKEYKVGSPRLQPQIS